MICHVYSVEPVLIRSQEQPPFTMLDKALALHAYDHSGCTQLGGKTKVKVGLRGPSADGPASSGIHAGTVSRSSSPRRIARKVWSPIKGSCCCRSTASVRFAGM